MQMFVTFVAVMAIAAASVNPEVAVRRALRAVEHEDVHNDYRQYAIRYVTPDDTVVSERSHQVPAADNAGNVLVTDGEVSYVADDGKTYGTKYSDEVIV